MSIVRGMVIVYVLAGVVICMYICSDKEMSLKQKSAKLHVLQKQVSQLRYALNRKDGSLHRAAKLFDEYKHR